MMRWLLGIVLASLVVPAAAAPANPPSAPAEEGLKPAPGVVGVLPARPKYRWVTLYTAPEDESLQRTSCLMDGKHAWTISRGPAGLTIRRTTDGWGSWTGNSVFGIPYQLALDMQFLTQQKGWLSGNGPGCIWRTDNGGETWNVEECPSGALDVAQVGRISMLDTLHGYAVVTESGRPGEDRRLLLYDGTNRLWKRLPLHFGFVPECFFALRRDRAWITGEPGQACRFDGTQLLPMTCPGSWLVRDIFFLDGQHGWMCGDGGRIASTTNGGVTWAPQVSGLPLTDRPPLCSRIEAIAFRNRWDGCAVTLDYGVLATTDGGAHWHNALGPMWHQVLQFGQYVQKAYPCMDVDVFAKGFMVTSDRAIYSYTPG